MILIDANILIYAVNRDLPLHAAARRWLEEVLSSDTRVGLPWIALLAFLRITTRHGLWERPLDPERALAYVDGWLAQPFVAAVGPGPAHWPILRTLIAASGTGGNLTSDAHLAALALETGATVCTTDHDFGRFPGVRWTDPLRGATSPRR